MPDRLTCLVPFCRRTYKASPGFDEWICGKHWRAVSAEAKAEKRKANMLLGKAIRAGRAVCACQHRSWRAWERCKAEAIEAAAGIS